MSRKGGVGGGCKHLIQHSASNHQRHLTSPCFKLRRSQHAELKGEELVSCSQLVQFTMQHNNSLKVDSEYSLRLLQNDGGKALSSQQKRTLSPLNTIFKCLTNQVGKGGVGGGCKHLTLHSASNQQPHLTSPCIKLRRSQHNDFKGE